MKTISTEELIRWLDEGDDVLLVDVLSPGAFEKQHIPGAVNVPGDAPDFADKVAAKADRARQRVVVYCASESCNASPQAAKKLEQAGFRKVYDYEQGIEGYVDSGRPVVGAGS
ncbi:MAG: rhodanese-like domain-containing protein [Planctomycetes bacterium]|nr:rhodanese-like domain-containing protein [Planctomycetota bacterium]